MVVSLLDGDHIPGNFLDRLNDLDRRVKRLERPVASTAVKAVQDSAQNIPNAAVTVVEYDTEFFDQRAEYDETTFTFTALTSGYYAVAAQVLFDATNAFAGAEQATLYLYVNAAVYVVINRQDQLDVHGATTTYVRLSGATLVYLEAGDALDVRVYQNSAAARALYASTDHNWLIVFRA